MFLSMKTEYSSLRDEVFNRIEEAARSGNIDQITQLSSISLRIKKALDTYDFLESEYHNLSCQLGKKNTDKPVKDGNSSFDLGYLKTKSPKTILSVQIDWDANDKPYGVDVFCETKTTTTMVRLMERIYSILGDRVLEIGSRERVSRGPLLSNSPEKDYANQTKGGIYQHSPIGDTGYYVLTHSDTDQKVKNIMGFLSRLGLVPGSFSVCKVQK